MKIIIMSLILLPLLCFAQNYRGQNNIADGNKVKVEIWNYGSLSSPGNHTTNFVWHSLQYAYEFNWFVGAEVPVPQGSHPDAMFMDGEWRAHIISDGLISNGGEVATDGSGLLWGWMPIESGISGIVYQDLNTMLPKSNDVDMNNDQNPESWPQTWQQQWPGKWFPEQPLGDNEIIYGMDDRDNKEFKYYPFPEDSSIGGLGVEVEARVVQMQDFYEDIVFVIFDITNKSSKDLNKMMMGVWGDPHIGGPLNYADDLMSYNKSKNLMYAWDADGISDVPGVLPGYFGVAYLQTPGNDSDGIDNDQDGMIDESPFNGIDDDGDWNFLTDDVGQDGIPSTGDEGEGNGIADVGEPNFEMNDIDETDMIGLTSSRQEGFGSLYMSDDEEIWNYLQPGLFDTLIPDGDRAFLNGSGYFSLKSNSSCQVGIAFVLGSDLNDLYSNTDRANEIYKSYLGSLASQIKYSITSVDSGDVYISNIPVSWESENIAADSKLEFALSNDNGQQWQAVERNIDNSGNYNLDVSAFESSGFYKVRSRVLGNSEFGQSKSGGFFTIDNSGEENVAPEILPLFDDEIQLTGDVILKWLSSDVDGNDFSTTLILESNLVSDTLHPAANFLILPTRDYPNAQYTLRFIANDGIDENEYTKTFTIFNIFDVVDESLVNHIKGSSESKVSANIVAEDQLNGSLFKLFFNNENDQTTYSVYDSLNEEILINNELLPQEPDMGSKFNGIRLSFIDIPFGIDEDNTGWSETSNIDLEYHFTKRDSAEFYPSDYEIRFFDDSVGVAVTGQSINFEVWNITRNLKNYVAVTEPVADRNGQWNPGDNIFILENADPDNFSAKNTTWQVVIAPALSDTIWNSPKAGDVLIIKTFKPLTQNDIYLIDTTPLGITDDEKFNPNKFYLRQNYPNPFNNSTKFEFYLPEHINIKIEIFDILGKKVFIKNFGLLNKGHHQFIWDGKNNLNNSLSSGVYFYRIKGKSFSGGLKKMVLIR